MPVTLWITVPTRQSRFITTTSCRFKLTEAINCLPNKLYSICLQTRSDCSKLRRKLQLSIMRRAEKMFYRSCTIQGSSPGLFWFLIPRSNKVISTWTLTMTFLMLILKGCWQLIKINWRSKVRLTKLNQPIQPIRPIRPIQQTQLRMQR